MRKGLNKVFVSLARRNQSLLHRQLAMLEAMERRATDPETLEDLFGLDHLTTRMRRHSEGLIILSGSTPGRGWRVPVTIYDVVRVSTGTSHAFETGVPKILARDFTPGGTIDITAPLPPHMQQSWSLLGLDAARYDPIVDAPAE